MHAAFVNEQMMRMKLSVTIPGAAWYVPLIGNVHEQVIGHSQIFSPVPAFP
jgi:hypothetical protein